MAAPWWVRADGTGRVPGLREPEAAAAIDRLVARYVQYRRRPPSGREGLPDRLAQLGQQPDLPVDAGRRHVGKQHVVHADTVQHGQIVGDLPG